MTPKTGRKNRRNRRQHISLLLLIIPFSVSFVAIASSNPHAPAVMTAQADTGETSLAEHSTAIIDVMAYIILALCSGLVALVLWNVKDMKESSRKNHEELKREMKKKVSIQVHNSICEKKIEIEPD